jgi:hypothetical protein
VSTGPASVTIILPLIILLTILLVILLFILLNVIVLTVSHFVFYTDAFKKISTLTARSVL